MDKTGKINLQMANGINKVSTLSELLYIKFFNKKERDIKRTKAKIYEPILEPMGVL